MLNPASPLRGVGRAMAALRKALRAGPLRKASRRTAAERADRDDCLICRACVSF
jgi:hypothetical protein